jgi:O-antigen/teichoic acid export membrane protein
LDTDDLKQKVISSSFWSSLEKVAIEMVAFLVFLILARLLQPTDYGTIAIAMVFVTFVSTISGLGISTAVIQIRELEATHLNAGFWSSLLVGVLLCVIIYACAPYLATFYNEPELEYVLLCLGLIGIFQAVDAVPRALLSRDFRFRYLAFGSILSSLVGGAIGITMAVNDYGVWALVAQQLSTKMVQTIITWIGAGWIPTFDMRWKPLKRLLRVGLYVMGSRLSNNLSRQTDNLLVGTFLGTRELGVYSIGFRVYQTANSVLLHSLSRLGLPTFSRLQVAPALLANAYHRLWITGTALTLPVFILIMLTASDLVPFLFGSQWQDSATVVQIFMIASCCQALTNFDGQLLVACGNAKLAFRLSLVRAFLNVIGFAVAVKFGINAVAAAFAIAALMMLPVWKIAIEKYSPVSITHASGPLLAVGYGLIALSVTALLHRFLLPDISTVSLIASQWVLGLFVYSFAVYVLDQSVRAGIRDLLKLGFGKT